MDAMNKIPVSSMSSEQTKWATQEEYNAMNPHLSEQAARAEYNAALNLQNQTATIFELKPEPVEDDESLGLDLLSDENE